MQVFFRISLPFSNGPAKSCATSVPGVDTDLGGRFLICLKGINAIKPFLGCSGTCSSEHTVPAGSQERGTGEEDSHHSSSADCSLLSPAVPSAAPRPSTWCRVNPRYHFLRPLGEQALEALLWKAECFKSLPWPGRRHRQLPGCKAFLFHITLPFQLWTVAKQNPSVPHHGR